MILRNCVCIPTYDNPATIAAVVQESLEKSPFPILIVDDGSRVPVAEILHANGIDDDRLEILRFEKNRGKGAALAVAIRRAVERGFTHLITLDGDGQHFPSEIMKLANEAKLHPWDMIIGLRTFEGETVPGNSKFGRRFSNFWVDYQTGQQVRDSQSGFRVYPLFHVQNFEFWTKKFDFEIEVLIRLIWKGVQIREVPIDVHYPKASERVSHFHKFRDNARISILNTWLVILSLVKSHRSPARAGLATGIGIWIGCTPFFGFHSLLAGIASFGLRLNFIYLWLGTQVSIPPLAPFLAVGSIHLGAALLGKSVQLEGDLLTSAKQFAAEWLLGSLLLGFILGTLGGTAVFFSSRRFQTGMKSWNGRTRGGRFGNGFLNLLTKYFGLWPAYICLYFIVPYFYVFAPRARLSANEYWKRRRPSAGFWARQVLVLRQMFRFAQVLLDRLYQSHQDKLTFRSNPHGIENIVATSGGLIMLSAHTGAWDIAAALLPGEGLDTDMHIVHYRPNGLSFDKFKGKRDQAHLHELASNVEGQPVLKIRDLLARGFPLGLMGDRPISNHFELIPFMGRLAPFDTTPFRLAASCGARLLFTFGFKGAGDSYDFFATPAREYKYTDTEDRALRCYTWAAEFAQATDRFVEKYPEQWFNFFPFWSAPPMNAAGGVPRHQLLEESYIRVPRAAAQVPAPSPSAGLELQP